MIGLSHDPRVGSRLAAHGVAQPIMLRSAARSERNKRKCCTSEPNGGIE